MKYYHLGYTGKVFPQASCLNQSYAHLLKHNEILDRPIQLKYELNKGTKATDIISEAAVSGSGILLNQKALDIFLSFNLINHKVYPAEVYVPKSDQTLNYFWLHLAGNKDHLSWIDFPKSGFYTTRAGFFQEYTDLASFQDYLDFRERKSITWSIETDGITLTDSFPNLDLFVLYRFTVSIFVSEGLKTALTQEKISGISFETSVIK